MRKHVYTIFGLIMLGIFLWRMSEALRAPGIGISEAYAAGGIVLALILAVMGVRMWMSDRRPSQD